MGAKWVSQCNISTRATFFFTPQGPCNPIEVLFTKGMAHHRPLGDKVGFSFALSAITSLHLIQPCEWGVLYSCQDVYPLLLFVMLYIYGIASGITLFMISSFFCPIMPTSSKWSTNGQQVDMYCKGMTLGISMPNDIMMPMPRLHVGQKVDYCVIYDTWYRYDK